MKTLVAVEASHFKHQGVQQQLAFGIYTYPSCNFSILASFLVKVGSSKLKNNLFDDITHILLIRVVDLFKISHVGNRNKQRGHVTLMWLAALSSVIFVLCCGCTVL